MDPFREIRPYNDEEIRPVLDRLLETDEFIRSLAAFSLGRFYRYLPGPAEWLTRYRLARQLRGVNDVASMQDVIAGYMDQMIERTTSGLTHSGLEYLSPDKPHLFISNHRDIAMDPAFVNYMLYHAGFDTVYIAIGDNLLKRPFVTDLMRLNKSFIVKRSLRGRELLRSSKQLSEYIHHCIDLDRNVWIAQREGRAKDGVDRTETALLKMLTMARKKEGLARALRPLHIVPVAISYQFDPCDTLKASELYYRNVHGDYQKDEQSDIHSIVTGMLGFKGHVHVSFGSELALEEEEDVDSVAARIDSQIIREYRLQDSNFLALEYLRRDWPGDVPPLQSLPEKTIDPSTRQRLDRRLQSLEPEKRRYLLQAYANPVISRYASTAGDPFTVPDAPGAA